jgi:internalin A
MKNLTYLCLGSSRITDAGMKQIAGLQNLTRLDLGGGPGQMAAPITDAGLKELASLKKLTILSLLDAKVTDAGLKELKRALPQCRIDN